MHTLAANEMMKKMVEDYSRSSKGGTAILGMGSSEKKNPNDSCCPYCVKLNNDLNQVVGRVTTLENDRSRIDQRITNVERDLQNTMNVGFTHLETNMEQMKTELKNDFSTHIGQIDQRLDDLIDKLNNWVYPLLPKGVVNNTPNNQAK